MMRRFNLIRRRDPSGVSGTGKVAEGVQWPNGWVAMQWCNSPSPIPAVFESIDKLLAVHGHGDATSVFWIDEERWVPPYKVPVSPAINTNNDGSIRCLPCFVTKHEECTGPPCRCQALVHTQMASAIVSEG